MNSTLLTRWIALVLILALVGLVSSFLLPLLMGAVLAVLLLPVRNWMQKHLRMNGFTASAVVTLLFSFWILVPLSALTIAGTRAAVRQFQQPVLKHSASAPVARSVAPSVSGDQEPSLREKAIQWMQTQFPDLPLASNEGIAWLEDTTRAGLAKVGEILAQVVAQLPYLLATLGFVALGLFFSLMDGQRWIGMLGDLLPYSVRDWGMIRMRLADACRSVVLASLVSGAAQSILALLFFLALRVPSPVLLSFLVFIGSFVPVVGALPVTVGAAIYLAAQRYWFGVAAMLIGIVLVSTIDNGVRPWILKGRTNLHPLLALLAALGGIQWMGVFGVFLGPILAALALTVYDLHWGHAKS